MKLKNNRNKIFWGIFFVTFVLYFCYIYYIFEELPINFINNPILRIIISGIFSLIFDFFTYWIIIIPVHLINLGKNKSYKEKLSENDLKNNDNYFRNILNEYNPVELSYIDDFKLDYPKDIIAILLHLNKKGKINFNKENGTIEYTEILTELTESEKLIINLIDNGKINYGKLDLYKYESVIRNSCLKHGLIKLESKKISIKKILILIFIYLIAFFALNLLSGNIINILKIIFILIFILAIGFLPYIIFCVIVYLVGYLSQKVIDPYIRTVKGEEVNKKLEGLKNYLEDFSSLDEKNIEELILWEDYLVYSVLFNQNKKIINEIYNTYFIK